MSLLIIRTKQMELYRDIERFTAPEKGIALALGWFDGVHMGHRVLISRMVELASNYSVTPVCFSFFNDLEIIRDRLGWLTTPDEKVSHLEDLGIEKLICPPFKPPLISTTADDFIHKVLIRRWHSRIIVAGFDFRFGKDRAGDTGLLMEEGEAHNIEVEIIEPFEIDGQPVKASSIRKLIHAGEIGVANRLLGWKYTVTSTVIPGRKLGKKIGFPTMNFAWPRGKVAPKYGIYAVLVYSEFFRVDDSGSDGVIRGVANFGVQPTIDAENRSPVLEVHAIDDVPVLVSGERIPPDMKFTVEFHEFIRPEEKFDTVDELREQIAKDIHRARHMLSIS